MLSFRFPPQLRWLVLPRCYAWRWVKALENDADGRCSETCSETDGELGGNKGNEGETSTGLKALPCLASPVFSVPYEDAQKVNPIQVRYQTAPRPDVLIVHHLRRGVNP